MKNSGSRSTVAGMDAQLVNAIANHLKKMGVSGSVCKFDSLPATLSHERDGLLILAAASATDVREVIRWAREICLQQWPMTMLVAATETACECGELTCLNGHVAEQFQWPREAAALAAFIKEWLGKAALPRPTSELSLSEEICAHYLPATPGLWHLADSIAAAATHDINVLITGETGTGKTFLTRVIHDCSPRKDHGLVIVPCGALVPALIESELFGRARGAFTGADRARVGRFAAAGKGTLLLDEIEALGLEQQASLLRVIETGEFEAVGSTKTQVCSARVVAACNQNLEDAVQTGRFRSDLYYRLASMAIHLPPLRERVGDIPLLTRNIVARFNRKFNKGLFRISPEAIMALQAMPWPGNLRQLENVLLQAVLFSTGPELHMQHLPPLQ
jgi:DNA-binding NtrC family response regulator